MFTLSVRQRRRVLVADLVSTAVFPLAITGATAAVPDVSAQLPGPAALGPWIVLAYNGLFAAALLLAGATADRSTRTRFFAIGNIVVAATGLFSALAPNLPSLVALRAVGGIGAAMCAAGGSSMVLAVYPPEERRRVYGYAGAVLGSSLALGPVVAQALMAVGGWPLVFVVPGAVAAVAALTTLGLPGLRNPEPSGSFDRAGAVLFGVTVAAAVTALGLGFGAGVPWWGPTGLMLVAAACATGLVRVERRAADPAIPVDLLRIPAYRAYAVATGAFMGMLVVGLTALPQLGSVQHLGAGEAAVMLSLLTVPSTVLPLLAARLARRLARPLVTTVLFACTGTAAVLQVTGRPAALLVAAGVIGLCLGLTEGVPDGQALTYVPAHRGGAGAALFSTTRMSLETLTLAAATGVTAALGPASGLAVAGAVCLAAALVVHQAVPARADGASVSAGSAGSRTRRGSASAGSGRSRGR
ncbi:MFS transporter [Streptomyces sp. Ag109_G2-15]|uniref:MFS transporter n=1 Tax=Streptomyces sp. Ag109_G2-15 TaxID=1938850 RepID=UPI000BCA3751|nr:MFS transporter [Streptomyces sp. Ag109_G2-15]SOD85597.1 Major Facilitator Superfamily protein [Streptomyces sp. Ag109_G2-15]